MKIKGRIMSKLLLILIFICFTGCANMQFHVCGLNINEMRNAKASDYGQIVLGATASFCAHAAGHYLAAEIFNVDIHQQGLNEIIDYSNNPSNSDINWFARSGFLFQLAINTALVKLAHDSYFTKGYTAFTTVELLTYNLRHINDGDFNLIEENNGNGSFEYFLFLTWDAYNFYRISLPKKSDKE